MSSNAVIFKRVIANARNPVPSAMPNLQKCTNSSVKNHVEIQTKKGEDARPIGDPEPTPKAPTKTTAQMDVEMKRAMEGLVGSGGESALEFEDGKPVSMKRGVRDNMFRYI